MDTTQFKQIGFTVCESHFKTQAAMSTWVLREVNRTNKSWIVNASIPEVESFWQEAIKEQKQFVKDSIGESYEPKPWEALSHLILDN